ncbi:hypothetical protein [Yoonia sp.]|uniref:hypothetical protein n=1 Tax=Yoonia sp. TaxID=2212373 RepID=UPI0025E34FAC|nr:hypothetical protein [Yoonia sp.]
MTDLNSLYPDDQPAPAPDARPAHRPSDTTEAVLYPDDHPKDAAPVRRQTRQEKHDTGSKDSAELSYEDSAAFNAAETDAFFNQAALAALQDGDSERSAELGQAGKSLVADMKAAGTPAEVLNEALRAYNETAGDGFSEDQRAEMAEATMAELQSEHGPAIESDLNAARAFIQDMEQVAPGLIRSLEATGAGNNKKLIATVILEAKRRGYGRR